MGFGAGRLGNDIDETINGVQATEQVIILAVSARQKRSRLTESSALQVEGSKSIDAGGILRANAVDLYLIEFPGFPPWHYWKRHNVPEGKPEIVHQQFTHRSGGPVPGFSKKNVDVRRAGVEIEIRAEALDERINLIPVPRDKRLRIFPYLSDFGRRWPCSKDVLDQIARCRVDGADHFSSLQCLRAFVELAFQAVDDGGIQTLELS
ncbi:hypothetical protein GALL_477830 [mine drainage metagenome]|uniref:Uncharacterized protein n=1 Tax=mine drainage metagenome TaxID=410659 RepID=A0A1J5PZ99_9ZZZZ